MANEVQGFGGSLRCILLQVSSGSRTAARLICNFLVTDMEAPTTTLRAVSDPTRCKILELLRDGSRSVTDLAHQFSMSRPAVSKHLGILRDAGLVASRREGRQQIYELEPSPLRQAREWLEGFEARDVEPPRPRAGNRRPAAERGDWRCW